MRDLGLIRIDEPFTNLLTQGMVLNHIFSRRTGKGGVEYFAPDEVEVALDSEGKLQRSLIPNVRPPQFHFDPVIPFNSPPLDAIIYLQVIGVLHKPLAPGMHVIKLDEKVGPIPIFGGVEFHNTFNVTVQPESH